MAYYEESPCLDLTKHLLTLEYDRLVVPEQEMKLTATKTKVDFSTNAYLFFKEKDILKEDIRNLCEYAKIKCVEKIAFDEDVTGNFDKFPFNMVQTRVCQILQKYHEQPALLGDISKYIIEAVMHVGKEILQIFVKEKRAELDQNNFHGTAVVSAELNVLFQIIYVLIKIRGTEKVRRFFPHEARDFEPVIFSLASQANSEGVSWEANYVLLIWLSLILLMPFDLKILDSNLSQHFFNLAITNEAGDIVNVIIEICKLFLNSTTRTTIAAGICLGRLFSRADVKEIGALEKYVEWVSNTIKEEEKNTLSSFYIAGLYSSICAIFKALNRADLLQIQDIIYNLIFEVGSKKESTEIARITTVRHYLTKLSQRLGLSLVPVRECTWVYKRTKKNLLDAFKDRVLDSSLIQTNSHIIDDRMANQSSQYQEEQGLDDDVDLEKLEEIIGYLFDMLKDPDTVVRWSAAKGLGRITARLDLDLADDIIQEIIASFQSGGEAEWHGGLLALGELCRRGLLLPQNLPRVVHILKKGLTFEKSQGTYTSGSNVRDAACYVAWTFSRAYEPTILQPYVVELSSTLLICALFDKEVTCRRAAAAAFQENVGRQGNFPHGIAIITEADYFSLAVRQNAYTKVAVFVAGHKEYLRPFIEHLAWTKISHCDIDIRKLSAATLCLLSVLDPKFMIEEILPGMIKQCTSPNFYARHGAIYAVSEIILGLSGNSERHSMSNAMKDSIFLRTTTVNEKKVVAPGDYMKKFITEFEYLRTANSIKIIPEEIKQSIIGVIEAIENNRLYRGKGGKEVRIAVALLIKNISISKIKITRKQHTLIMNTIDAGLKHPDEDASEIYMTSLLEFSSVFHKKSTKEGEVYLEEMLKVACTDPIATIKRGYTLAQGAWSPAIISKNIDRIIEVLLKNCEIHKKKSEDDAETRKNAVKSLKMIFLRLPYGTINKHIFNKIVDSLCYVMDDYTVDRRGDIGSMVRETSMYAMLDIVKKLCDDHQTDEQTRANFLDVTTTEKIIGLLLQQLVEKIDKMRLIAGSILQNIFDTCYDKLPQFSYREELFNIFSNESLRERVKHDQDRIDIKFDISLVSTEFLSYEQNEAFIYFWNIPQCVFPLIIPIANCPTYTYNIIRGISLSAGGITLNTHEKSVESVVSFIDCLDLTETTSRMSILDNFLKALKNYRRRERFITPLFSTLAIFYQNRDLYSSTEFFSKSLEVFKVIKEESFKTKYATKLMATAGLICPLLSSIVANYIEQGKTQPEILIELEKEGLIEFINYLLNHE